MNGSGSTEGGGETNDSEPIVCQLLVMSFQFGVMIADKLFSPSHFARETDFRLLTSRPALPSC